MKYFLFLSKIIYLVDENHQHLDADYKTLALVKIF